jgi:hypothetical protein
MQYHFAPLALLSIEQYIQDKDERAVNYARQSVKGMQSNVEIASKWLSENEDLYQDKMRELNKQATCLQKAIKECEDNKAIKVLVNQRVTILRELKLCSNKLDSNRINITRYEKQLEDAQERLEEALTTQQHNLPLYDITHTQPTYTIPIATSPMTQLSDALTTRIGKLATITLVDDYLTATDTDTGRVILSIGYLNGKYIGNIETSVVNIVHTTLASAVSYYVHNLLGTDIISQTHTDLPIYAFDNCQDCEAYDWTSYTPDDLLEVLHTYTMQHYTSGETLSLYLALGSCIYNQIQSRTSQANKDFIINQPAAIAA